MFFVYVLSSNERFNGCNGFGDSVFFGGSSSCDVGKDDNHSIGIVFIDIINKSVISVFVLSLLGSRDSA